MGRRTISHTGMPKARGTIVSSLVLLLLGFTTYSTIGQSPQELRRSPDGKNVSTSSRTRSSTETLTIRLTTTSASIRDQYVYAGILHVLLRDRASKLADTRTCNVTIHVTDRLFDFDLRVRHPEPTQRDKCFLEIVRYIIENEIEEADFVAARATKAQETTRWTASAEPLLGIYAAERLAYLAIYQPNSPLHQLYSVSGEDVGSVPFESFRDWMLRNRLEKLIAFDAQPPLPQILGLGAAHSTDATSISLSSSRAPSGTLVFDGERFGVPALIMVSLDPHYAAHLIRSSDAWRRFACNRPSSQSNAGNDAILSIACFSHFVFATDAWLGLAVRKSNASGLESFCRQVRALADDPDVQSLVRNTTEKSRGLYVLLPSKCTTQE